MVNLLDADSLLGNVPNALPTSATTLATPQDALAVLLHTAMIAVGFRLVATDEAAPVKEPETSATPALPEDWNKKGPDMYTFKYRHNQNSLMLLLKLVKLSGRVIVHGTAMENDKTQSLEINIQDYLSPSFFPYDVKSNSRALVDGYLSSSSVTNIISLLDTSIIQPLVSGAQKEAYQDSTESTAPDTASTSGSTSGARPPPLRNPSPPPHNHPFADPYAYRPPSSNPLQIGRSDLDPLGGRSNPFAPPPLFGPPGSGGDGMYVGPNHPIFNDPLRQGERGGIGGMGPMGPWGGDGYLPPMGAPPGARFDPIGPGPLAGRGPGRRPPYAAGNPDNDEFMPPGMGGHPDMYM